MFSPEYWNKEIKIEAEDGSWGRTQINYTPYLTSNSNSNFNVSDNKYLTLQDIALSGLPTISTTFPIPNTLSTKYNIYCVFVPSNIVDSTDKRPYKVKFNLSYINSAGSQVN